MMTVLVILAVAAFVCAVLSAATSYVPLWVAVVLLCVVALLQTLPLK